MAEVIDTKANLIAAHAELQRKTEILHAQMHKAGFCFNEAECPYTEKLAKEEVMRLIQQLQSQQPYQGQWAGAGTITNTPPTAYPQQLTSNPIFSGAIGQYNTTAGTQTWNTTDQLNWAVAKNKG